jgi:hypothetical protein
MLSFFLEKELALNIILPKVFIQIEELITITSFERFCNHFKKFKDDLYDTIGDGLKLQLCTCGAYAIISLPAKEGLDRSRNIFKLIEYYSAVEPDSERAPSIQAFVDQLANNVGERKSELETCLHSADVEKASGFTRLSHRE